MQPIDWRPLFGLVLLFTSTTSVGQSTPSPRVLDVFPKCEYDIADTVTLKQKVILSGTNVDEKGLYRSIGKIIDRLKQRASDLGVDSIALIDRKIIEPDEAQTSRMSSSYVSMTAQLFSHCGDPASQEGQATPYNSEGRQQKHISSTISLAPMEIRIERDEPAPQPDVTSHKIDLKEGALGIQLGVTEEALLSRFGTPSLTMQLKGEHRLVGYGRSLWFVFRNNQLVDVSNRNRWLSVELLNFLETDERLTPTKWKLAEKFVVGQIFSSSQSSPAEKIDRLTYRVQQNAQGQALDLLVDEYHSGSDQELVQEVVGFRYHTGSSQLPAEMGFAGEQLQPYDDLERLILSRAEEAESITITDLPVAPFALGVNQDKEHLALLNNHLVAEFKGANLSKIHFLDKVLHKDLHQGAKGWRFAQVHQGMKAEQAREALEGQAFELDDIWQLDKPHYMQNLFFDQQDGNQSLIASEVLIF